MAKDKKGMIDRLSVLVWATVAGFVSIRMFPTNFWLTYIVVILRV